MPASYLWQCYMEATNALVGSGSLSDRLRHAAFSLTKLSNTSGFTSEFRDPVEDIYGRIQNRDALSEDDQRDLANDILQLYVQICVHTEASEWITRPGETD